MTTFVRGLDPKDAMKIGVKEIYEKVLPILQSKFGDDVPISLNSNLQDDLGMDSLDAIEIIMDIEKEFDITIDDANPWINNITTVGDIINFLLLIR